LAIGLIPLREWIRAKARQKFRHEKSVSDRVAEYGAVVHPRLGERFRQIGVAYPPKQLVLLGLKKEKQLEVWVGDGKSGLRRLTSYPILAASGKTGPKLAEGDYQVPEGLYRIESLNPNSLYHLALRVGYPNAFDQQKGREEGRTNLGSDIMIHGKAASVGCLAMGDPASEDIFVLAAETGLDRISVILSPVDFRVRDLDADLSKLPKWAPELYASIKAELGKLKP
jgi:hypothetical protein